MGKTTIDSKKMYTFIRGYASGLDMTQTLCALAFARKTSRTDEKKAASHI